MSTVGKALGVLDLFKEVRPAIGLSEAARLLDRDKATVQRYLTSLEARGFLEQDPLSKAYHLGPAVTRLATVRNQTYPVETAVKNILADLVQTTGETGHVTHYQKDGMSEVAVVETTVRGTRVYIDHAELLPLHATASGIAYLSSQSSAQIEKLLSASLEQITDNTPTDRESVLKLVEQARANGYANMFGTFETDVVGIAAPIFNSADEACGAVAVATPASRFTQDFAETNGPHLMEAARSISRVYGAGRYQARQAPHDKTDTLKGRSNER